MSKKESHLHSISVQLYAYDVVNANGRVYPPGSIKVAKRKLHAVHLNEPDFEQFAMGYSASMQENVVGWASAFHFEEDGVYADVVLSKELTQGKKAIERLEQGYTLAPAAIGSLVERADGVATAKDIQLTSCYMTSNPAHQMERVNATTWKIKR